MQIRNPAKGFFLSPGRKDGAPPAVRREGCSVAAIGRKERTKPASSDLSFSKKTRQRAYGRASGARTAKGKKAGKRRIFRPFARLLPCRLFPFHNGNTPLPFRRFSSPGQSVPFSCIGRQ